MFETAVLKGSSANVPTGGVAAMDDDSIRHYVTNGAVDARQRYAVFGFKAFVGVV